MDSESTATSLTSPKYIYMYPLKRHCNYYFQDDFATFSDNFEMTLDLASRKNPFLLVVLGDFNAKLSQWHDKDSSNSEGISVERITPQFWLHEIINESTHIL